MKKQAVREIIDIVKLSEDLDQLGYSGESTYTLGYALAKINELTTMTKTASIKTAGIWQYLSQLGAERAGKLPMEGALTKAATPFLNSIREIARSKTPEGVSVILANMPEAVRTKATPFIRHLAQETNPAQIYRILRQEAGILPHELEVQTMASPQLQALMYGGPGLFGLGMLSRTKAGDVVKKPLGQPTLDEEMGQPIFADSHQLYGIPYATQEPNYYQQQMSGLSPALTYNNYQPMTNPYMPPPGNPLFPQSVNPQQMSGLFSLPPGANYPQYDNPNNYQGFLIYRNTTTR